MVKGENLVIFSLPTVSLSPKLTLNTKTDARQDANRHRTQKQQQNSSNLGFRSPSTERIVPRPIRLDRTSSRKDSSGITSHFHHPWSPLPSMTKQLQSGSGPVILVTTLVDSPTRVSVSSTVSFCLDHVCTPQSESPPESPPFPHQLWRCTQRFKHYVWEVWLVSLLCSGELSSTIWSRPRRVRVGYCDSSYIVFVLHASRRVEVGSLRNHMVRVPLSLLHLTKDRVMSDVFGLVFVAWCEMGHGHVKHFVIASRVCLVSDTVSPVCLHDSIGVAVVIFLLKY